MAAPSLALLVVDDDEGVRRIFSEVVGPREGVEVLQAGSGEEALELLRRRPVDVAFVDVRMPGLGGMELLARAREGRPDLEVVIITAFATVESAVQAMKMGASDYLPKPFKLDQVALILSRLKRMKALKAENERLRRELQGRFSARNLVVDSGAMARFRGLLGRVAREECNVLLLGESGTGKELAARALHYDGPRRDGPFVCIDCTAVPPNLFESELFGHEEGAFTGARGRKAGLLEAASGGTAFLDEVAELPPALQAALLRAIEEKKVRRVGGTAPIPVDVRLVAATNRPLEDLVERGEFRRDLYYRLNVVTLRLPPLRERKEDIPLLVAHFLRRFSERGGARRVSGIRREALHLLQDYDWPGNVRELEHVLERACALGGGEILGVEDLPPEIVKGAGRGEPTLREMEIEAIRRLLREHRGDTARVSGILGIHRSTLYRKLRRYGIRVRGLP